jgi:hypothetical protein
MKRLGVATILIVSLSVSILAYGKTCEDESIEEVAGDGAILTMLSGSIWKVDEVDRVDSGLWLGTEDVLICYEPMTYQGKTLPFYTIINKDEEGEEVHATRIGSK